MKTSKVDQFIQYITGRVGELICEEFKKKGVTAWPFDGEIKRSVADFSVYYTIRIKLSKDAVRIFQVIND